jgi:hypothetical protein
MIAAAMLGAATATTSAAADEPTSFDVAAQVSAARAGIEIDRIVGSGSGCPQGTWGGYLSDDRQTFYLRFSEFRPEITPASSERTASCRLAIVVSVPAGLSYQIQRIGYRGYAYLEQGVSAEMSTSYYFQNDRSRGEQYRTPLKGPLDDTYSIDDQPLDGGLWSPCGRSETQTLNVQLDVKLRNGSPRRDGTLELNEALGFRLGWRRCDRR